MTNLTKAHHEAFISIIKTACETLEPLTPGDRGIDDNFRADLQEALRKTYKKLMVRHLTNKAVDGGFTAEDMEKQCSYLWGSHGWQTELARRTGYNPRHINYTLTKDRRKLPLSPRMVLSVQKAIAEAEA